MEFERTVAVRAAMDAFWKRGFEAVSVSDLADAMAITRSSFYNSFGDRETVFREALDAYRATTPDAGLAALEPGQPVGPAIRKMFRDICRVRAADPDARGCLIVNAIAELAGSGTEAEACIAGAVQGGIRVYERLLRQAAAQGEIDKPANLRATARGFVVFLSGLNLVSKVVRDEGELWRLCEDFLHRYGFGSAGGAGRPRRR